jgi:hypothetical protein
MKKVIILFIALCSSVIINAQDINYAEYFIDTDPGYGGAVSIPVSTPGNELTLQFSPNILGLDQGFHYIHFRARDVSGRWGTVTNAVFLIVDLPPSGESNIDQAEYFIDTDPGYGEAVPIPVSTPGNELTLLLTPDILGLDQGFHYIHFRARDVSGRWGTVINTVFHIVDLPPSGESNIELVEYFIDTDPGYGNGTPATLPSAGNDLTIDFTASLSGLANGNHVLYIRAKNDLDKWGQVYAEGFAYNATGISQEEINSLFKIYPNPTKGQLQIEITDQTKKDFRIRIMDINGKLVYENECFNNPCDLSLELPSGMYLLTIDIGERRISQKIIFE